MNSASCCTTGLYCIILHPLHFTALCCTHCIMQYYAASSASCCIMLPHCIILYYASSLHYTALLCPTMTQHYGAHCIIPDYSASLHNHCMVMCISFFCLIGGIGNCATLCATLRFRDPSATPLRLTTLIEQCTEVCAEAQGTR